jgi:hypothetical protein
MAGPTTPSAPIVPTVIAPGLRGAAAAHGHARRRPGPRRLADRQPSSRARTLAAIKSLLASDQRNGYLPLNVGAAVKLPHWKNTVAERILPEPDVHRLRTLERAQPGPPAAAAPGWSVARLLLATPSWGRARPASRAGSSRSPGPNSCARWACRPTYFGTPRLTTMPTIFDHSDPAKPKQWRGFAWIC